jgi:imidazolonepropionase-like amidohydrolase
MTLPGGSVAYRFDGVGLPDGDDVAWWVEDGRLRDTPVDAAEPLPGRYVLPGLVDAHCHLTLLPGEVGPLPARPDDVAATIEGLRRAGVLALRDTGAHDDTALRLSAAAEGDVQVIACGRFLSSPDHYFPGVYRPVAGDELVAAALAEVASGARWVKLVADFPPGARAELAPEPTYDVDTVAALVAAVHDAGARVAAHVTTSLVRDLVRVGIDSVEHGTALDEATLGEMARRGTAWTPTLSAVVAPPPPDAPPERLARREQRIALMRELLPKAVALGVPVLTGSDVVGTVPGEVAQLASYGLAPVDALRAATTVARSYLGFDRLQTGAPADLVTYDDDPREDPEVLARPAAVVARGVRVR